MFSLENLQNFLNKEEGKKLLTKYYGISEIEKQKVRWLSLAQKTFKKFDLKEAIFVSSPGRTELGGNHTDHNDGCVLCASIHLDTLACVCPTTDNKITLYSEGWDQAFTVDLLELEPKESEKGKPEALLRGIAYAFKRRNLKIGGFVGCMTSDVPKGSGLSSSASVEVLFGQIENILFNKSTVEAIDIAIMGQEAENLHFGKPCGLEDQAACALGGISAIDFGHLGKPKWSKVNCNFEKEGYQLALVNVGSSHEDLTEAYASIPKEMKAIAELFGLPTLRKLPLDSLVSKASEIRKLVGDRALLRAFHFIYENKRVNKMKAALEENRFKKYLKQVNKSGDSSWKLLQNVILSGAIKDQSLAVAIELAKVFIDGDGAARVHGGGFAGTIQAYVPTKKIKDFKIFMDNKFGQGSTTIIRIRPFGAGKVTI